MVARNEVYLLLGGNIKPRLDTLKLAILKLQEHDCNIKALSSVYESEAWGFKSEQKFLNQLLVVETERSPSELLYDILKIEKEMGRTRQKEGTYISRNIDIDILYFGHMVIHKPDLVIPHPRLHKRRFALLPLVELAPAYLHPVFIKTNRELLDDLDDPSDVTVYNEKEVCSDEI